MRFPVLIFVFLAAASAQAQVSGPRVSARFEGCPSTYGPLVSRFVELEIGIELLGESDDRDDYRALIACTESEVELRVGPPGQSNASTSFDLTDELASERPRIIGLRLAYLLEEATADWVPPPAQESDALPAPPNAPPLAPEREPDPEPRVIRVEVPQEETPKAWSLMVDGGFAFTGSSAVAGPRIALASAWRSLELPFFARVDLELRLGAEDSAGGTVDLRVVAPGAFAGYATTLDETFAVQAGLGYRLGHARLEGNGNAGVTGSTVSGLWHGPAARVGTSADLGALALAFDLEAGVGVRRFEAQLIEDTVNLQGLWVSLGLSLEVPLT
ncbi:MAG: hypothetical protein AAF658_00045 [Myxococcota bacterium]